MQIKDIKTGTKLNLEIYGDDNQKNDKTLVSQFEYSEGNNYVVFQTPVYKGVYFNLRINTLLNVIFVHKDKVYSFRGVVVKKFTVNELPFVKVEVISEIVNIQRRSDYRLECTLQIKYREVELEGLKLIPKKEEFTSTWTVNISGGGICIVLNEELPVNTYLECVVDLEENLSVGFIGKIVRIEKIEDESAYYKYRAGMSYQVINNKDREAVVKFIFKEQRKLRRKGII